MSVPLSKKTVGVLLFALAILRPSFGQSIIDSLENKLKTNLKDSSRIETLIALSKEYQYSDLKKSITIAEEAMKLAEQKDIARGKANSYHVLATYLEISGDFGSSAKYNDLALSIRFQLKDTLGMARSYNNLGQDFMAFGKFDEAYSYFTQSHRFSSKVNDSLGMAIALHNIGTVFKYLKQYKKALQYFRITQGMSDAIGDHEGKAYNYDEIGDVYRREKKYDSALYALKYSLSISRNLKLFVNELKPGTLIKIAETYLEKGDDKQALAYYDSAQVLFAKTENEFGIAQIDLGRGKVFMKEKKVC